MTSPVEYWDQRARDFAGRGAGLRAVCSYGMPAFYNGYIHLTQRLALAPYLRVPADMDVLDIGCGIGRWTRRLARDGARVVGVDVAGAMIEEAERRTEGHPTRDRVSYRLGDIRTLDLGRTFDRIVTVTVMQHVLDDAEFARAGANIALHLAPSGRAVLLEAAPSRPNSSCDTHVFRARTFDQFVDVFRAAGLRIVQVSGVDPAPFKQKVLPRYRTMKPLAATSLMLAATLASLPYDALFGRRLASDSWHKVFVLDHDA